MTKKTRTLVAMSIVLWAVTSVIWVALMPAHDSDPQTALRDVADGGAAARLGVIVLVLGQLPFMVGVAGLAAWLHPASRRLATAGGVLGILGGFGHTVFGGAEMVRFLMASDPARNAALAGQIQSFPPLMPFMAAGLIGTVLGLVLLGAAHVRAKAAPRWAGPVLWAFVLVEFVGSNLSDWATYLSLVLLLAAAGGLAAGILTSPTSIRSGSARPASSAPADLAR